MGAVRAELYLGSPFPLPFRREQLNEPDCKLGRIRRDSSGKRRRKSTAPQPRRSIEEGTATNVPTNRLPDLPYIEETIEHGGISIGVIPPLRECIAVAHEGRHTLAMLKRQKSESLAQRLSRLDLAMARAQTDDIFTDETNPPANSKSP
jgi:hypothetical protein